MFVLTFNYDQYKNNTWGENAWKQSNNNNSKKASHEVTHTTNTSHLIYSHSCVFTLPPAFEAGNGLCNYGTDSSVTELLCTSASCDILHLMSTWTAPLYWQSAWREFGCMNPLILELLSVCSVICGIFAHGAVNVKCCFVLCFGSR